MPQIPVHTSFSPLPSPLLFPSPPFLEQVPEVAQKSPSPQLSVSGLGSGPFLEGGGWTERLWDTSMFWPPQFWPEGVLSFSSLCFWRLGRPPGEFDVQCTLSCSDQSLRLSGSLCLQDSEN